MIRIMSDDEVQRRTERRSGLYTSNYVIDVITAVLMDTGCGSSGICEDVARTKATRILSHLGIDPLSKTNKQWTEEGFKKCAVAHGVLALGNIQAEH